jgi:prepilin-type N-terminal cleavage/methylation domain-containing protein
MIKYRKNKGFTFVELMFAVVVMGTMFALAMVVIVGMLRFYVFASTVRQNQENGRNLLDTINREMRFGELLVPISTASKICVVNKTTSTITGYRLITSSNSIEKRVYSYPQGLAIQPNSCDYTFLDTANSGFTKISEQIVNPSNMKVTEFATTRVRGSSTPVNDKVLSAEIKMTFVTGNLSGSGCATNDIYCNKFSLNTALNIRGSD